MTNDDIEGRTETATTREGTPLVFVVGVDCIDTGLSGIVTEGGQFVVSFRDWITAEECVRLIRADVARGR